MNDAAEREYEMCLNEVAASQQRLWQSLTALGAVGIAVTLGLAQIVPDEDFDLWFRLAAGWIGYVVILFAVGAWTLAAVLEHFKQHVASERLAALEESVPFRLGAYARAFNHLKGAAELRLTETEVASLRDSWRHLPRGLSLKATCWLLLILGVVVEILLLLAAILTSYVLMA